MKITHLTLGLYQTNCYLVQKEGSTSCCMIDPGYEPNTILEKVQAMNLTVDAILLTHGHFDHVGAVKDIAAETDCRVFISADDLRLPPIITSGKLYYTDTYPASGSITAAGLQFTVIPTPGHTPGSVCLICENILFSGDTLFCGSCGRTDLPGGNQGDMISSLRKIAALPGNYLVYPGHGSSTELSWERESNPYLK